MPSVPADAFRYYGLRGLVPVTNVMMLVSGIVVLVAARKLSDDPPKEHRDKVDLLASVGNLGISIAVIQTLLVFLYLWMTRNFSGDNPKFRSGSKLASVLQGITLGLTLVYLIVASFLEEPVATMAHTEIRAVRFAAFVFLFFYGYVMFGLVKSGWMTEQAYPIVYMDNGPGDRVKSPMATGPTGFNSMA